MVTNKTTASTSKRAALRAQQEVEEAAKKRRRIVSVVIGVIVIAAITVGVVLGGEPQVKQQLARSTDHPTFSHQRRCLYPQSRQSEEGRPDRHGVPGLPVPRMQGRRGCARQAVQ